MITTHIQYCVSVLVFKITHFQSPLHNLIHDHTLKAEILNPDFGHLFVFPVVLIIALN